MKRPHEKLNEVFKCYPLFTWRFCCNCGDDFRRESGWRFLVGPYHGGAGSWRYICRSCAPTEKAASDIVERRTWMPNRPPPPPGPPSPQEIQRLYGPTVWVDEK